jgi:hypothetical protein
LAKDYRNAADQLKQTMTALYFDPSRKLFSDTPDKRSFSQASNVMAVMAGLVPQAEARDWMSRTLDEPNIEKCGLYFRYYLHATANAVGLGDRFLDLLDPWRKMLERGMTTWAEFDSSDTRSDCHAWSASPNIEVFRTVLGIDSAAPGFKRVIIRPSLGKLTRASGAIPHPKGEIAVSLALRNGKLGAEVTLPPGVVGDFVWRNERRPLSAGMTKLTF